MGKRYFIDVKRVKSQHLTPLQLEIERTLSAEKQLTALWYSRISGETEWKPGERERMESLFAQFSEEVKRLQAQQAAETFATLPAE